MFWREKKAELQDLPLPRVVFLEGVNVRSISESFGKPHLSLILTNQSLTIMVRGRAVINIVPL